MNIVLFSMPDSIPHFSPTAWKPPSLACGLLAANTPKHDVFIADLVLRRGDVPGAVQEAIKTYRPRLVGLSAMSFQYDTARHCAKLIRKEFPDVKIAIGGYHATLMFMEISEGEDGQYFDFILRGEGDKSFAELADAVDGNQDYSTVRGLTYIADGEVHHNPPRELEDLETIAYPKRDARIWTGYGYYMKNLDVLETSRGCVMACTFCSMQKMYGKSFRRFPLDRVIADIADAKAHGVRAIAIGDDNITLDIPRFEELCDRIVAAGLNDVFYIVQASSHGIASSESLVRKMDRANFRIVFLGIENVSARSLKHMKKGNIVEKTKEAVRLLHKYRIMIVGGMIIGHPWDDEKELIENYDFFDQLDIDFYGDQIITPYPKTIARDQQVAAGSVVNPNDFRWYNGYWANIRTDHLTADELLFLRWKHRRLRSTFYKTTKAFRANFPVLDLLRKIWFRHYKRLKEYIQNRGMTDRQVFEREMTHHILVNNFFGDREPYRPFDHIYANVNNIVRPAESTPTPGGKDPIADWQEAIDRFSSAAPKRGSKEPSHVKTPDPGNQ
ncbi:MAG: radical SAM protein [Planctomycetota bacterium]